MTGARRAARPSGPAGPSWARGTATGRQAGYANPDLRVSDAERTEVADQLAQHYGEGRLDEAEFNERLEAAMKARTQADLSGLLTDLPAGAGPGPEPAQPRPRRSYRPLLAMILLAGLAVVSGRALAHGYVPWVLVVVVAFLVLRRAAGHGRP